MTGPRYLAVILAVLSVAALAAACTLSALHNADASWAWTLAATSFGTLLGVHVPAPGQTS